MQAWGSTQRSGRISRLEAWFGSGTSPSPQSPPWLAAATIAVLLAACWLIAYLIGGTGKVSPYWFYIPILLAASRLGMGWAVASAVVAGVLAGPLLPFDVQAGEPQSILDILVRAAFFVVIGFAMAVIVARRRGAEGALDRSRQTISRLNERLKYQEGQIARRREATERVQEMLGENSLNIVVQPIADLETGRVVGVEALTRFNSTPDRTPDVWFVEAAEVGLGLELELKALRQALALVERLPENVFMSINLSPNTIGSPRFHELLDAVSADRVVLEVTEHAPVENYDALANTLEPLRKAGCRLAVDDAGAGFASFRHILRLNPDIIKLDMTLTRNIDNDPARRALAAGLISFASDLGASIIAEGIETASELGALRTLKVGYGQGYYLARPEAMAFIDLTRVERTLMPRPLAGTGAARRPQPRPPTIAVPVADGPEGPDAQDGEAPKEFPPAYRFGGHRSGDR
jgi:EAL domain-containing protein (putative c-di-GMP-specific phosphodiesterase class I)